MNLVYNFDLACLEHINVLCTWCSIRDYPRVVTSMREGKAWTPCTFTFDRLDRVVLVTPQVFIKENTSISCINQG
jgi:hypothetical protein